MTGPRSKSCDIEGTLIRGGEKLKAILLDNDSFCIRRCQQTLEDGAKCGGNLSLFKKKRGGVLVRPFQTTTAYAFITRNKCITRCC